MAVDLSSNTIRLRSIIRIISSEGKRSLSNRTERIVLFKVNEQEVNKAGCISYNLEPPDIRSLLSHKLRRIDSKSTKIDKDTINFSSRKIALVSSLLTDGVNLNE